MENNKPFFLSPAAKDYLWGGRRLNDDFAKGIDMYPLAETWECSTHPDGLSLVATGEYAGMQLDYVLMHHPEYIGSHPKTKDGQLPILIKFIDADKDLSVQVHPDDAYAQKEGQMGKTEMWYVLDATKNARLIYGLKTNQTKAQVRNRLHEGRFEEVLNRVPVHADDVFFIKPGTIHAIGAGTLIAEIQENSNLTYRLYDYDRVDKNGEKRPLHIDKALDVAELSSSANPRQPMRILKYHEGCARELLCRCKYFEVNRMLLNTERVRAQVSYQADESSFRVLLCYKGCGCISFEGETLAFYKGDCLFVPANSVEINIHGKAEFLDIRA